MNPRYRPENAPEVPYFGRGYRKDFVGLRVKNATPEQIDGVVEFGMEKVDVSLYNFLFFMDMKYKYYCTDFVSRAWQHVLVEEDQQTAPTLENFEDYAPVDVPTPAQTPTRSISLQLRNCNDGQPKSANEYQTLHQSQFSSELRVPSMEKKGKDDLSYFYDTPASFDTLPKQAVQCPSEWEETTKREGEASVRI
jgi:hypothetical protein